MKIFDYDKYRVRKLTPTEYGRLQAFPMERWNQVVSDSQAYKQFGNAVTTTLFSAIAEQIKKSIMDAKGEKEMEQMELNNQEERQQEQEAFTGMNAPESVEDAAIQAAGAEAPAADKEQEADAVAPTRCQPGKAVDVWDGEDAGYIPADALAENITNAIFTATLLPGFCFDEALKTIKAELEKAAGKAIGTANDDARDWDAADKAVKELFERYAPDGYLGKTIRKELAPVIERLEAGERTPDLFNTIVAMTR